MKKIDYLVIGQGIAGTLLAHELSRQRRDFVVIDPNGHNASKTAAGMYNPVVLKRFSPVWQGKAQILTARQTVAELEKMFNTTLDNQLPIQRLFHNAMEKQTWSKKALDKPLDELLDRRFIGSPAAAIYAPYGLGTVNFGGRINLPKLLAHYRQHLAKQGKIRTALCDYRRLKIAETHVEYDDIIAEKVVFCEGYGIKQNPFFNQLPLNGNKGEVLTVRIPHLHLKAAIKSKVFLLPLPEQGEDIYFVGATYHWTDKDDRPTAEAKQALLEKLRTFVSADIEVLAHRAGVRPTVADRRPLLGQHHIHRPLYVLNGLGTRGVMLGATMAKQLYQFIEDGMALDPAVNIQRFTRQQEE